MFQKIFNKSLYSWDWTDGSVVIGALAALPEDPSLIPRPMSGSSQLPVT